MESKVSCILNIREIKSCFNWRWVSCLIRLKIQQQHVIKRSRVSQVGLLFQNTIEAAKWVLKAINVKYNCNFIKWLSHRYWSVICCSPADKLFISFAMGQAKTYGLFNWPSKMWSNLSILQPHYNIITKLINPVNCTLPPSDIHQSVSDYVWPLLQYSTALSKLHPVVIPRFSSFHHLGLIIIIILLPQFIFQYF